MAEDKTRKPTDSEMDILQILWSGGPATVRTIHDILSRNKESGYTTTLKLMQIMYEKKLVTRDESERTHIYAAAVKQESIQKQVVSKVIKNMFKGSPAKLILHALGNHEASKEELEEIRKYLRKIESEAEQKK